MFSTLFLYLLINPYSLLNSETAVLEDYNLTTHKSVFQTEIVAYLHSLLLESVHGEINLTI